MSDEDGAKHELTAEYVENTLLGDEKSIRETVRQNRSLGEWVRDQIDRILAKLGNAEEQAAAKERQELRRIRDLYAKALRERSDNKETASEPETDGKLRLLDAGENRSYRKTSFVSRQKRFFMERVTRLELATSTLARWRSTG